MNLDEIINKTIDYLPYVGAGMVVVNQLALHGVGFFYSLIPSNERAKIKIDEKVIDSFKNLPKKLGL
jgi:hypothetical protein